MIRLDLPREPHWLDLPHGVRLQVRPLDTATDAAARAAAVTDLRERGKDVPPAAAKDSWRMGQTKDALARALGQLTILDCGPGYCSPMGPRHRSRQKVWHC